MRKELENLYEEIRQDCDEETDGLYNIESWTQKLLDIASTQELLEGLDFFWQRWRKNAITFEVSLKKKEPFVDEDGDGDEHYMSFEKDSWCFFALFEALTSKKDPTLIPALLKYFPDEKGEWIMEDLFTEMMLSNIAQIPGYIPELLQNLHLLMPRAKNYAGYLISDAMYDSFRQSEEARGEEKEGEIFKALPLADKDLLLEILDAEMEYYQEKLKEKIKKYKEKLFDYDKAGIIFYEEYLQQIQSVKDALLKLHEKDPVTP